MGAPADERRWVIYDVIWVGDLGTDFSKSAHLDARVSRVRRKLKRSPPRWNDAVREQDRAASGTALGPDHRKTKGHVFAEREQLAGARICLEDSACTLLPAVLSRFRFLALVAGERNVDECLELFIPARIRPNYLVGHWAGNLCQCAYRGSSPLLLPLRYLHPTSRAMSEPLCGALPLAGQLCRAERARAVAFDLRVWLCVSIRCH